jgi:hypothetical protein
MGLTNRYKIGDTPCGAQQRSAALLCHTTEVWKLDIGTPAALGLDWTETEVAR